MTTEKANSTSTVENENYTEQEVLNSTDDAKGDEEVIEALETTEIVDAETTTKSTKRRFFRNRGRRTRITQF